jgi:hypothetical protein
LSIIVPLLFDPSFPFPLFLGLYFVLFFWLHELEGQRKQASSLKRRATRPEGSQAQIKKKSGEQKTAAET